MKTPTNLALVTVLALTSGAAQAMTECHDIRDFAGSVSAAHQQGVPFSRVQEIVSGVPVLQAIAADAYRTPPVSSESQWSEVTEAFADEWYTACLRDSAILNDGGW